MVKTIMIMFYLWAIIFCFDAFVLCLLRTPASLLWLRVGRTHTRARVTCARQRASSIDARAHTHIMIVTMFLVVSRVHYLCVASTRYIMLP